MMARVTVVVTTRNRKEDLRICLASVQRQTLPVETIVIDDASTDGTGDMIRAEFPDVRLICHQEMHGYIRGRNEGARLATGEVLVSLDDDAAFSSDRIIEDALACFDDDRVAAVAIPYIDVNREPTVRQVAPDANATYVVESFIGTSHALRRSVFVKLGGYREELFHQGEESDYCVRLLAAGYVVRLGHGRPDPSLRVSAAGLSPDGSLRSPQRGPVWMAERAGAVRVVHLPITIAALAAYPKSSAAGDADLRAGRRAGVAARARAGRGRVFRVAGDAIIPDGAALNVRRHRRSPSLRATGVRLDLLSAGGA